jgi:hypothetical protein
MKESIKGVKLMRDCFKICYNEYEVACYAAGAIEVVVSFDEMPMREK